MADDILFDHCKITDLSSFECFFSNIYIIKAIGIKLHHATSSLYALWFALAVSFLKDIEEYAS